MLPLTRPAPDALRALDTLELRDIELWLRIGITEQERAHPQRLFASVTMYCDTSRAGRSDRLADSIDYASVAAVVSRAAELECETIEFLAESLAGEILSGFSLTAVGITVKKYPLPQVREVSISIVRSRG